MKSSKISGVLFLTVLGGVGLLQLILPKEDISVTERRRLTSMPEASLQAVWRGDYMEELENFLLDHFPGRDSLRWLCNELQTDVLGKRDVDGYYRVDGSLARLDMKLEEKNVAYAASHFHEICVDYFPEAEAYYSIIPDKNYFLAEKGGYVALDYDRLNAQMEEGMPEAKYLPIYGLLEQEDYYRSDLHWRQECIVDVAEYLAASMSVDTAVPEKTWGMDRDGGFFTVTEEFYGGYAGASGLSVEPDRLCCYWEEGLDDVRVYDYEKRRYTGLYHDQWLTGGASKESIDPYDLYLWGAKALLGIENPGAYSGKRLVIFRDSFAGSLAPLLIRYYEEILLVDLRYISLSYAMEQIDPGHYDTVLFLYHTGMLNHSGTLRF